jgi:monoamine oxidase
MNSEMKVAIVGAGVAGLVAAIELEKAGIAATIYESTDKVGGRVKNRL